MRVTILFSTASLLAGALPAFAASSPCTLSLASPSLPYWYMEAYSQLSAVFEKHDISVLTRADVEALEVMSGQDMGTGMIEGVQMVSKEPPMRVCRQSEKCFNDMATPVCVDTAAKTIWVSSVLISTTSLDYTLPDCTTGNLVKSPGPLKKYAQEVQKLLDSSDEFALPEPCQELFKNEDMVVSKPSMVVGNDTVVVTLPTLGPGIMQQEEESAASEGSKCSVTVMGLMAVMVFITVGGL